MKSLLIVILFVISFNQVISQTFEYSPFHAAKYAQKYWGKSQRVTEENKYFPRYPDNNNCCNFINQCLIAGLCKNDSMKIVKEYTKIFNHFPMWYYKSYQDRSRSWSVVHDLFLYASNNQDSIGLGFEFISRDYQGKTRSNIFMDVTKLKVGDIVFMDWEADNHFDHVMIVSSIINTGKYYNDVRLTGHTNHQRNWSLLQIKKDYKYKVVFYVYRPIEIKITPNNRVGG